MGISASEEKVTGGHQTKHLLGVKVAQWPLTLETWASERFQMPGSTRTLSRGLSGHGTIRSWALGTIAGGWIV